MGARRARLGCLRVGGSGRGHWRFADGGGDISVAGRAFFDLLLRFACLGSRMVFLLQIEQLSLQ